MIAGPENQDTDFTWAEFVRRNNDELVATWGNLVHRTLVNAHRNFGSVPERGALNDSDQALIKEVEDALDYVAAQLGQARFQVALKYAMTMAAKVNVYLGTEQPWHTIKTDRARAGTVLYVALRCVDNLKLMLTPFLPFSSQRLHEMLGYSDVIAPQPEVRDVDEDGVSHRVITGVYPVADRWHVSQLAPGHPLPQPLALFKRLDDVPEDDPGAGAAQGDPGIFVDTHLHLEELGDASAVVSAAAAAGVTSMVTMGVDRRARSRTRGRRSRRAHGPQVWAGVGASPDGGVAA